MKNWYESTLLNIHYDHHATGFQGEGSGADAENLRRCWEELKPDMIQMHSKGHAGYALYPTVYGVTSPGLEGDPMAVYSRTAREMGIRFSVYYSIWLDACQSTLQPDWCQVDSEGNRYNIFEFAPGAVFESICMESPYLERVVYPMLKEIVERYEPDGFWFDGDIWARRACWCKRCKDKFRLQYGIEAPVGDSPELKLFYEFHRNNWHQYLINTRNFIRSLKPDCLFASNWAFTLRHAEDPTVMGAVDYLSGDIRFKQDGSVFDAVESRVLASKGMPFDLMTYNRNHDFKTNRNSLKSRSQLLQQAATVCANGGRFFQWINPNQDDSLNEFEHTRCANVFKYIREHREWFEGTVPVGDMALVYGPIGSYPETLKDNGWNLIATADQNSVRAAHRALTRGGYHCDIITDRGEATDFSQYQTLILPDTAALSDPAWCMLKQFVQVGGTLILTPDALRNMPANELEELRGGVYTGSASSKMLGIDTENGTLNGDFKDLSGSNYHTFLGKKSKSEWNYSDDKSPLLDINMLGKGTVISIHSALFKGLFETGMLADQVLLENIISVYARTGFRRGGDAHVECVLRSKEKQYIVHMINYSFDDCYGSDHMTVRHVPPVIDVPISIVVERKVSKVSTMDGSLLKFEQTDGEIKFIVPKVDIHNAVLIQWED